MESVSILQYFSAEWPPAKVSVYSYFINNPHPEPFVSGDCAPSGSTTDNVAVGETLFTSSDFAPIHTSAECRR